MGDLDQNLIDAILAHHLDLLRLDAGTRVQVIQILERMQKELVYKLASEDLTDFGKQRTSKLLKECTDIIHDYYTMAQGELALTSQHIGPVTAKSTTDAITAAVTIEAKLPTETFFRALVSNVLVNGSSTSDWWERQSLDMKFKFSSAVRQGLAQGETNLQIINRVVGKRGQPGIMEISRTNAAALVQTSVQAVANTALLETYKRNADVITSLVWLTALDGHVCPLCAARADLSWDLDGNPIGHSIPFDVPPIHFNDRCVLVPRTKTFKELGIDLPEPARTTRASTDGPVAATTTFALFLKRKGEAFQDEVLGKGRAQLWRDGTITLQNLLNLQGNPLTIAQLKAKYA